MPEKFQPISHHAPDSFFQKILVKVRLVVDFQFNSVYSALQKVLPHVHGKVADIGCGNSPFEHLLNKQNTEYTGLDYDQANEFNYKRNDIIYFDGKTIPFNNESFDFILCTEVIEHVEAPQEFINETYRILKKGGKAVFTVPWSARFHYIPYDYYRYTPTALKNLFKDFTEVDIKNRGTDVTVIASKIIVLYFGQLVSLKNKATSRIAGIIKKIFKLLFLVLFSPFLILAIISGHLSLLIPVGSIDDCLGYTITLKK